MKKWILYLLCLLLAFSYGTALAEDTSKVLPNNLKTNIRLKQPGANPLIPGESPTTGLPSASNKYIPILVQIDNSLGAIPQWGISAADVMYELPIQGMGWTRLTALFADQHPDEAGPVRSGRIMHADLREEWDSVLVHFGKQEVEGSDMRKALADYRVGTKGLDIDGIGNKYKDYFARVKYHAAPHNVSTYVKGLSELPQVSSYQFPVRPFKFTDDKNYGGAEAGRISIIHKGNRDTSSTFVYDVAHNGYARFIDTGAYFDLFNPTVQLYYSNVIVQRTRLTFNNHGTRPLLPDIVGQGAADIFLAGQHISGAWSRSKASERTIFYDQNGEEIALQRGKTWIVITDEKSEVILGDLGAQRATLYTEVGAELNPDDPDPAFGGATVTNAVKQQPAAGGQEAQAGADAQGGSFQVVAANSATVKVGKNATLNFRKKASTRADLVGRIPDGAVVEVLGVDGEWAQIKYEGNVGFAMVKFLEMPKETGK